MNMNEHPSEWLYKSPEKNGLHVVVSPENSPCKVTWVFRLNLEKGQNYTLYNEDLELNGVIISGCASLIYKDEDYQVEEKDSFYLPGKEGVEIEAKEDVVVFIGGGPYEGKGKFFTRKYDLSLPLGDIHQVHGKSPYQREVFMTIAQQDEGSRLICGITFGEEGKWTSWPPHQHSKDLEEVYCYFNIPAPSFAMHLSSRKPGEVEAIHKVSTGDFIIVPEGYHPTVGMPGVKSCYFWVMVAHSHKSRRYDLAVNDPNFE